MPLSSEPLPRATAAEPSAPPQPKQPLAPPAIAQQLGLMPLDATGVTAWRRAHPTWDGRGVLIAILDSGGDVGVAGLQTTTTGAPKVLDLREVSGEGDVPLGPVRVVRNVIVLDSTTALSGAPTVAGLADDSAWYGGVLRELPFGEAPAADFNANGTIRDRYGIVVVRSGGRWIALIDTNGDGSLTDETPISDFLVRRETFTFSSRYVPRGRGPITGAVNLTEEGGRPKLSIFLDTSGHGTHVAGIAAGHNMYGLAGFHGVAPGAQLIIVKLAHNARGGVTSNGSMLRAMEYAARFAAERQLPLVINISFGIGNEQEGRAAMDSIVDAFARAHPAVPVVIAGGNDGPGTSTVGLPGSSELALTAGASYPGSFSEPQFGGPSGDMTGWWSSRGGELAKPDVLVPGMAYSTVPRFNTGEEIKLGTSMAAPHLTGLAALLLSAALQENRTVTAADLAQALRVGARPFGAVNVVDQGAGLANVERSWRWLAAGRSADQYQVRALTPRSVPPGLMPAGGGQDAAPMNREPGVTAAYRRGGLLPSDTVQRFRVALVPPPGGRPEGGPRRFRLVSEALWLRPLRDTVSVDPTLGTALIDVRLDQAMLRRAGRHVGSVAAFAEADSAAGPAFRLVSTVIVPESAQGRVLSVTNRKLTGGTATRVYVAVPEGAGGLAVRAALRGDTTPPARLYLFEPGGRPARTTPDEGLGGQEGARATLLADANDVVPGVYEVVVQAMPGHEVTHDLDIVVPAVRVAAVDSARRTVTFASSSRADTVVPVTAELLGIATSFPAVIENGATFGREFAVPAWARSVVVEVVLESQQWNDVTDLAISVWDHSGQRLGGGAMNYPFHRVKVDLPERRAAGYRVTAELFPGFARPTPPARFPTRMRVIFLGEARALGEPANLPVRAGATAEWQVPAFTPLEAPGPEWLDWVRVRAAASQSDWVRLERSIALPRP